jgi:SAM-dependent methyltransferase
MREKIVRKPSQMFFLQQCHPMRQRLRRLTHPAWLGTIRRTKPLSEVWGLDRGTPVDRYYIERFLEDHRADIRGRVLEVKDSAYTDRYGNGVAHRDVLDIDPTNPLATIVADLAEADAIPSNTYDCFILTQTLQFIYDTHAALSHARRILRPDGVLLATVPAIIRVERSYKTTDYWRFTVASCSALFSEAFGGEDVSIRSYGNVLSAVAFLTGMAHQELSRRELETYDEYYPVIVAVRAVKHRKSEGFISSHEGS